MCGIAGVISRYPLSSVQTDQVRRIQGFLAHRGPDGAGWFGSEHVLLMMRRLSIIDLASGWQPLYNEDRSLALIANGEIYNFIELRRDLEASGHRFSTGSDCETILHLYEDFGAAFVSHLRGMYAFALWDSRARRLILGRDRMGEKPLYLARVGEALYFSSELKALIRADVVPFQLDAHATHLYYHYGYVPEPDTIVQNIRKLPAAHLLTIDLDAWSLREQSYWHMEDVPALEGNPAQRIREQLEEVSPLVTRADVPVGVSLSGGLDASTIAALATSARHCDIHAFSVGYVGRPWQDERREAEEFANYLGIPFHSVELSTADMIEQFSRVNYYRDDPIADIAGVPLAAVAQLARRTSVPVLLFGHGGDELFWGYEWVRRCLHSTRRRVALQSGLRGIADYVRIYPPPLSLTLGLQWAMSAGGMLSEWRQYKADQRADPKRVVFYENETGFRAALHLTEGLYTSRFSEEVGEPDLTRNFTSQRPDSPPEVILIRLICETYLMENGIAQADRLSMAASVESRLPLVDYRLVETVIGLHKTTPLDATRPSKQWLREAMGELLPDFVLSRRKRGFSPPGRQWVRALSAAFGQQLTDGYLVQAGIIRPEAASRQRKGLDSQFPGPQPFAGCSLVLENWCRHMSAGDFQ
jgi:asparagine synthase (glutamine-hydrolysing)